MAQYLKDEVHARIDRAALEVFARQGYRRATVAEIARRAGISTGNVYRYYRGKRALLESVVPPSLASELEHLVHERVRAVKGVRDVTMLSPRSRFRQVSEELLRFAIGHRLQVVILLDRSDGTVHEGFGNRLRRHLEQLALEHFGTATGATVATREAKILRFTLERIYLGWLQTLVAILETHEDEDAIREAVDRFSAYHLAGLKGLLLQPSAERGR